MSLLRLYMLCHWCLFLSANAAPGLCTGADGVQNKIGLRKTRMWDIPLWYCILTNRHWISTGHGILHKCTSWTCLPICVCVCLQSSWKWHWKHIHRRHSLTHTMCMGCSGAFHLLPWDCWEYCAVSMQQRLIPTLYTRSLMYGHMVRMYTYCSVDFSL